MELKSIYNKIVSNNKKYPEYKIDTNIETIYPKINTNFSQIEEEDKQNKVFKCTGIKYDNPNGRISEMNFEDIT